MEPIPLLSDAPPYEFGGAYFSKCGRYRLMLERRWDPTLPALTVGMVNPSKAGAVDDDPTITRVRGFAVSNGYGGFVVVNVSPLISTDPKLLRSEPLERLLHPADAMFVSRACQLGHHFAHAWGVPLRGMEGLYRGFADRVALYHDVVYSLGTTKEGWPPHPLYLPADRKLEPWTWPTQVL